MPEPMSKPKPATPGQQVTATLRDLCRIGPRTRRYRAYPGRALGLPMRAARAAALRELVLQVPAPVAAALGFHHTTTQRQRAAADGTWNRYATPP